MLQKSLPRVILALLTMLIIVPYAQAHVKWFVPMDGALNPDFIRYTLSDTAVIVWIGIAVTLISSSVILDSRLPSLPMVDTKSRHFIIRILQICTGISLLLTSYNGSLVAPHYLAEGNFGTILLAMEALVGVLFICSIFVFYASIILLLLYLGVIIQFGFIETVEYWNIIGIAVFILFNSFTRVEYQERFKPYAVPVLRIMTGIALITLGLSEKLLSAEYGEAFVDKYQWNFMMNLGLEHFSDRLFVLSAGMMEVVFGIILILGTTTRLNILVVAGFMITSNITFLLEGNITEAVMEITGHLPVVAIAIICVFFGSGQKFKVTSLFNNKHRNRQEI